MMAAPFSSPDSRCGFTFGRLEGELDSSAVQSSLVLLLSSQNLWSPPMLQRSLTTFRTASLISIFVVSFIAVPHVALSSESPAVEKYLIAGQLAEGAAAMQKALTAQPNDNESRFSLGIIQFLQAVEKLGQDQFRFGLLGNRRQAIPFMRLPIGENPDPEQISYEKARGLVQKFLDGLKVAEATLAETKPADVKLTLRIGQIRLDLDGDGKATDEESLWRVLDGLQSGGRRNDSNPNVNDFVIAFDDGDAVWLRGYCRAMSALGEVVLAYDWRDQFERTAHLFYPNVDSPYTWLAAEGTGPFNGFNTQNVLDVIALIHTINYDCVEPERMQAALAHLESVISLSRESWKLINAETDNDHEWLPNTMQTAAMGGMRVSQEMQVQWQAFLNESEAILQGRKLLPFWRGIEGGALLFNRDFPVNPELGINLRKIFTEPARFDLILWFQGTGLHPFLEKGERTDPESWTRIMNGFRGEFFLFLAWFN